MLALLLLGVTACGSASDEGKTGLTSQDSSDAAATGDIRPTIPSHASPRRSYLKSDGDDDPDDKGPIKGGGDDTPFLAAYGKKVGQAEKKFVTALVKRYYLAAATGDGAEACSMLDPTLVAGLVEGQGHVGEGDGTACAATLSRLLEPQHAQLAANDVTTMVVVDVRVKGELGLAVLGFKTRPLSVITLKRTEGSWKINALFDSLLT